MMRRYKLEFGEGSRGTEQHCHCDKVAHYFVGISIEFEALIPLKMEIATKVDIGHWFAMTVFSI